MAILLVRHAEPVAEPGVDPHRWTLSEVGQRAARELGSRLPADGVWVSSTETKAYETLVCAGGQSVVIAQDPRLDEVRRNEPFNGDYQARRRSWVEGRLDDRHAGWETPQETAARFNHGVLEHAVAGSSLVVASHGMTVTAWLVHCRRLVPPQDAGRFWVSLTFPDVIEVE